MQHLRLSSNDVEANELTGQPKSRIGFAGRFLGALGGAMIGFIAGLSVLAFANFGFQFFVSLLIVAAVVALAILVGFCFPVYPARWSYFAFVLPSGDVDSDLPISLFLAVIVGFVWC